MRAMIVEEPVLARKISCMLEASAMNISVEGCFEEEMDALPFAVKNNISLAVLDVSYMGIRALQMGEELRRRHSDMMILYVTDMDNHMAVLEAVRAGEIQRSRHQSYVRLYEELKPLQDWQERKK